LAVVVALDAAEAAFVAFVDAVPAASNATAAEFEAATTDAVRLVANALTVETVLVSAVKFVLTFDARLLAERAVDKALVAVAEAFDATFEAVVAV